MSDLSMLTIRKLPVLGLKNANQNYRTRISAPLVEFVRNAVQSDHPGTRVGKRFALEYVLQCYLADRGLLRNGAEVPAVMPPAEVG